MNGFKIMSDSYRKASEKGQIDKVKADKLCKVLDFLATCDDTDICNMFDSSAFNEIAKSYLRIAVKELIDEGVLDEDIETTDWDELSRAIRKRLQSDNNRSR